MIFKMQIEKDSKGRFIKGHCVPQELRTKVSSLMKGRVGPLHPFFGKHHTEVWNKKNSESHKGKPHPISAETASKIGAKLRGKPKSVEHRRALCIGAKHRPPQSIETRQKRREKMLGDKGPNYKGGLQQKTCLVCGKQFQVYPYDFQKRKYCSRECKVVIERGERATNWRGGLQQKFCLMCGKEFWVAPHLVSSSKYCSLRCLWKSFEGEGSSSWQGGISKLPYGFEFSKELKKGIRERDNYRCQLCGISQEECYHPLAVHHVDYNKKNNAKTNLISLCHSCNSKVNANRNRWQLYFQQSIEQTCTNSQ